MPDNADEVLLAQLKSIRARFGDEAIKDNKVLAAILAAEVPEHKDKIDAFIAMLNAAPEPAPPLQPVPNTASRETHPTRVEKRSMLVMFIRSSKAAARDARRCSSLYTEF
jgi:hypothetical protein